jgi:MFS transporter, DHA1 family, staphyloferrin A biosynthesis exporter
MLLALLLALLVFTDVVQVWMVLAIAALRGVMLSVNLPTRQALLSDIVDREHLSNAIALNSATLNLTRVFGGSLGGLGITLVGVSGVFLINGLSFIILIVALAAMTIPPMEELKARKNVIRSIGEGLSYVRHHETLRSLTILALVPMIFGMPYMTMLTVFASDVLQVGGSGLGLLTSCTGIGAMTGALFVASRGPNDNRRSMMLWGLVGFGFSLMAFAASHWLFVSAALLVVTGFCQQLYNALNNTLIQEDADEEYRGRVVSTLFLNRGMVPLGTMLAGFGTDLIGAQFTTGAMATVLMLLAGLAAGRRLRRGAGAELRGG